VEVKVTRTLVIPDDGVNELVVYLIQVQSVLGRELYTWTLYAVPELTVTVIESGFVWPWAKAIMKRMLYEYDDDKPDSIVANHVES
jgi:hypothetical protein